MNRWKITALLAVAALIGAIAMRAPQAALYEWSKTAATNATADPSINWSEGMSPSSVNDSARAMMARVAEWRDDLSGLLATAGTSTAYTVTTNQGLPATPTDGQALAVTFHADNGVAPTLAADGGTAYAIQSAAGSAIGAGTVLNGTPYTLKFKLSATAWVLHGFFGNPYNIPLGGSIDYFGTTAPNSNFVFPFGQCVSRTTYATFFTMVSTTFGVCDGTTTFGIPDARGRAFIGKDDMGGSAASRITNAGSGIVGTTLGATGGDQNVSLVAGNVPALTLTGIATSTQLVVASGASQTGSASGVGFNVYPTTGYQTISATVTGTTANGTTAVNKVPPAMIVNKILRIF